MVAGERWAIYFAPRPETALARFGQTWFEGGPPRLADGRCLTTETYHRLTARPRLYGFHATLKAPFRLAKTETESALLAALSAMASGLRPVELPPLIVTAISDFLALAPNEPSPAADALAAACMTELDGFRAPLTEAEYARREPDRLSHRQRNFLRTWGYPYVLEEFRWHMTLADRLGAQPRNPVLQHLRRIHTEICARETVVIDSLSLVRQYTFDAPFELVERVSLCSR